MLELHEKKMFRTLKKNGTKGSVTTTIRLTERKVKRKKQKRRIAVKQKESDGAEIIQGGEGESSTKEKMSH